MARSFSEESMSDSHTIGETRYRMSHQPSTTTIARTLAIAGVLLAVLFLASQSFFPAFAQEANQMAEEIDYDENGMDPVATYTATDPEGEGVTWELDTTDAAAPDHDDFSIKDGILTFKSPPNFEAATDSDPDNEYVVKVVVKDTGDDMEDHDWIVTVNVKNVNEPGEVEISHPQPKENTGLTATLTDDDGPVTGQDATLTDNASTTWQWYRSDTGNDPWTKIEKMATSSAYTPVMADVGHYLRATATYYDGQDMDEKRTAHGISDNMVEMEQYINTPPKFLDADGSATTTLTMSVPEDESLKEGANVGKPITATDIGPDGSTQEVLTYTHGGTDVASFTIDSATGQLKLAAATAPILDFEHSGTPDTEYEVTVTATDPDGRSGMVTVTIDITDVDEAPTIPETTTTDTYGEEDTSLAVLTYTATDEDGDDATADNPLTWSLSGRDAADFRITVTGAEGTSGALTFALQPDFEAPADHDRNNLYEVTVNVEDDAGNRTSRNVTVEVTNFDEGGGGAIELTSHPQPEVGQPISFKLIEPDGGKGNVEWEWTIGTTTLTRTGRNKLTDSYTPRAADVAGGTGLSVSASYTDGANVAKNPSLSAPSVQDRPSPNTRPTFPDTETGVRSIPESTEAGASIGDAFEATDTDGDSTTLLYTLSGNDARAFTLASRTSGAITVAANTKLDYETKPRYQFTIYATDSSGSSDRASKTVTVNITNVLEDPVIAEGGSTANYPEIKNGRPNTDPVFTYTASDDETNNANLTWSVPDTSLFEINDRGARGTLRFKSPPDFEDFPTNPVTVTVTVTDGNSQTATRDMTVTVTNVDEPGEISGLPAQPKEGIPMAVTLSDPDGTVAGTTWQWSRSRSRTGGWTPITATSTTNMSTTTPSRTPEAVDVGHYLRATAMYSDPQGDNKTTHGITDRTVVAEEYKNEAPKFPPLDDEGNGTTTITMTVMEDDSKKEGDPVGDPVTAQDIGQANTQEVLIYTVAPADIADAVEGADQEKFTIDRRTGQLKLVGVNTLDYEDATNGPGTDDRSYVVAVKAIDPSNASTTATVTIKVEDVKEPPEFREEDKAAAANLAATSTKENLPTTTLLSTYTASDDEDDTAVLTWSLEGADKDRFKLCDEDDPSAGTCTDLTAPDAAAASDNTVALTFKEVPNFEDRKDSGRNNVYDVIVVAADRDEMKTRKPVTVTVTNEDDPGEVKLSHIQPEAGTRINAELTDPDGGVSGITWQWIWCDDDACAAGTATSSINAATRSYAPIAGNVGKFLKVVATYTDRTSASSQDKRMASEISTYAVQADDTGNQPPVLPDLTQTLKIAENSQEADPVHVVGVVAATNDPDDDLDHLLYTLSGSDAALFTIHSGEDVVAPPATTTTHGMIRLKSGTKLDFETKPTYRVTVTATDPSLARDQVSVVIQVTDVDEPPFVSKRGVTVTGQPTVSYPENGTAAVETYRAVGPDAASARWSLAGPDRSAFSIPNGQLIFASPPDFENASDANTDNVYSVTIMVTSGDFDDDLDVTVTVTNEDEPGTVTITPATQPRVGTELTAALTDEDGATTGVDWQWARSTSDSGPWANISGATSATYTPVDGDANNYLQATANYTDPQGSGKTAVATTTATVLGVTATPNDGTVSLPSAQPTVGTAVTASLTDSDGTPTGTTWQWARSRGSSPTGTWTNIAGATSASYTPVAGDAGYYLRATANYTDPVDGPNQTVFRITANPVQAATQKIHEYDRNSNGRIEISEAIEAVQDFFAGRTTIEVAIRVVQLYFSTVTGD